MANLSLVTADRVRVVQSFTQHTFVADEAIAAGAIVRIDTTSGKATNAKGTTAAEARAFGIATHKAVAGQPVTVIRRGIIDGFDLSGLTFDDDVFLSDTDGVMADAAGTVSKIVAITVPGFATTLGTAADKLLFVDL